ncbi:4'-phosphopantetheinyl transferase family protein [Methylophilus sp.]|uniref:4'-phosphopantetheinyl transferase family protein n=1 Tax=Methylophilus sp. TaxID=29541 RepID=UPI004036E23B
MLCPAAVDKSAGSGFVQPKCGYGPEGADKLMLNYLDTAVSTQLDQVYALDAGDGEHAVHISIGRMLDAPVDRHARRSRQSTLARQLLAHALQGALGREQVQHYALSALKNGKPLLVCSPQAVSAPGAVVPAISFSHSGDFVACAWSGRPQVGVDIEYLRPRDWAVGQDLFLHVEEKAWMAEIAPEDQPLHYYRLWCLKEACYKCLPAQTEVAMTEFCFSREHVLQRAPAAFLPLARWKTHVEFLPLQGVVLAAVW